MKRGPTKTVADFELFKKAATSNIMAASSHAMASRISSGAGSSSAAAGSSSSAATGSKGLSVLEVEEGVRKSEEYFGFSPVRFVDDVYNCASAYMKRGLDQMEEVLLDDKETRQHSTIVQQGIVRTQDKLTQSLDRNIDKFELYIVRNILSVPSHIDTSGVVEQIAVENSASHSQQEEDQLDEELVQLRRKIHSAEFMKKAMTEKMEEMDRELQSYRMVAKALEELDSKVEEQFKEHGVQGSFESALLEVMQKDPEMRALDKQYAALESMAGQEEVGGCEDAENVDCNFVRCRKQLGAPTTRALEELAMMLDAH